MASRSPSRDRWRRGRSQPSPGPSRPRSQSRRRDGPPADWPAAPPLVAIARFALPAYKHTTLIDQTRSVIDLDRLTSFVCHSPSCSRHLLRIVPSTSWPVKDNVYVVIDTMVGHEVGRACGRAGDTGERLQKKPEGDHARVATARGGCRNRGHTMPRRQGHHIRFRNREPTRPRDGSVHRLM